MSWRFEAMVARRYLRVRTPNPGQRRETFITLIGGLAFLGIMLGVATLIIVMSVMNGFRAELFEKIIGFNGDVKVFGLSRPLTAYEALQKNLEDIPGIKHVSPMIEGQAMIMQGKTATGIIVRGANASDLKARALMQEEMTSESWQLFETQKDALLIGAPLAQRLNLQEGDVIKIVAPEMNSTAFGAMPKYKNFTVVGTFKTENHNYDTGVVFIPLATAQSFFKYPQPQAQGETGGISALEIFLYNHEDVDKLMPEMIKAVDGQARLVDWRQTNKAFFQAVITERNVMFVILTLIILIAAFNIISCMVILVKDKTRDIGILRTMGATRGMIMRIFFLTGASIGVAGTLGGLGMGILFCRHIESIRHLLESLSGTVMFSPEIYFLSKLPAIVRIEEVMTTVLTGLMITFVFTLFPAWRAARLNPVEALRHE